MQATIQQINDWQARLSLDPEWLRVYDFLINGGAYADLSSIDKSRYNWVVNPTVRITENRFRQMQMGIISAEDMGSGGGTSDPGWFQAGTFWTGGRAVTGPARGRPTSWSPSR